jgi:hypothetical protein
MLVYLYRFLCEFFSYYYYASDRKAIENEKKLEEYMQFLTRDKNPDVTAQTSRNWFNDVRPPVEGKCVRKEGE